MKKKIEAKQIRKVNRSSERDQFTVVLEGLHSDFKVFGEALLGLEQKVEKGFGETDKKFGVADLKIGSINLEVGSINKRLDSHTEMLAQLLVDTSEIRNELKQKVGRDEFAKLEKRVLRLEHPVIA